MGSLGTQALYMALLSGSNVPAVQVLPDGGIQYNEGFLQLLPQEQQPLTLACLLAAGLPPGYQSLSAASGTQLQLSFAGKQQQFHVLALGASGEDSVLLLGIRQQQGKALPDYRSVLQKLQVGVFIIDARGRFIDVNPFGLAVLGYSAFDEVSLLTIGSHFFKTDTERQLFLSMLQQHGQLTDYEIELTGKSGKVIPVSVSVARTRFQPDAEQVFLGVLRDLSREKLIEQAYFETETRMVEFFNNLPLGSYQSTEDGKLLLANPELMRMLGLPPDAPFYDIDLNVTGYADPADRARFIAQMKSAGQVTGFEAIWRKSDGQLMYIRENARRIVSASGMAYFEGTIEDISSRMRMEHSLQASEQKFRQVIEHSSNLFYTHDVNHNLIFVSPQSLQFFGCSPEEAMVRWTEFATDNPINEVGFQLTERAIHTGLRQPAYELELVTRKGKIIWVEVNESPIVQNGRTIAITGALTDITEKKNSLAKQQESEERYHLLLRSAREIIIFIDPETFDVLEANQAFTDVLGYSITDAASVNIRQVFTEKWSVVEVMMERVRAEQKVSLGELRWKCNSGEPLYVQADASVIQATTGEIIYIIARDISGERAQKSKLLQLSMAVEQSPAAIIITNTQGNIEYVNPKFTEVTGYSAQEVMGRNPRFLKGGGMDSEGYRNMWETLWAGKEWRGEFLNKRKNGELFWETASISPINAENGIISHFLAVKEDISVKKQRELELIEAKQKAEEISKLKSNFLANMSHELRTPLIGILGFAEILKEEIGDDRQQQMGDIILKSGKRLLETLNLILDLSRLEAEKMQVNYGPVDLNECIADCAELFSAAASAKGLNLPCLPFASPVIALLDPQLVSKILSNLVNNAIKFTENGSITLSTAEVLRNGEPWVFARVEDTGIGIANEDQKIIFDEFRQVSEGLSRKYEGTGLGLSLTKRFVELMEGEITCNSTFGSGTSFTVYFKKYGGYDNSPYTEK